jgi:hypothetical protein
VVKSRRVRSMAYEAIVGDVSNADKSLARNLAIDRYSGSVCMDEKCINNFKLESMILQFGLETSM